MPRKRQIETASNHILEGGMLNLKTAANMLGVTERTVYALMDSQQITYTFVGKVRKIPRQVVLDYLAARLVPAR